jgi:hypothetical protein
MKHLFWLLLLVSGIASAQSVPTGSKTRWANGTYIGTKLDAYFNAADSNAVYWRADSVLMAKYKGTARALAYAAATLPYTGATASLNMGSYNVIANAMAVNGIASAFRQYVIQTSGVGRWTMQGQGTESGSNTGTDFSIARYDDAGTNIDKPFEITRSTGIASFLYQPVMTAGAKLTNQLDLWWGGQSILAGADNNAATRTDATQKVVRYVMPHYTNASSSVALLVGIARTSVNDLYIGGGSGVNNCATDLRFYTAANTTTVTGTQRARITSIGNLLVGTDTDDGTNLVQSAGSVKATQYRLSALNTAPSSATDTGTLGEIRITSTYIYVCTATNTWVRTALTTW